MQEQSKESSDYEAEYKVEIATANEASTSTGHLNFKKGDKILVDRGIT